MVMLGTLGWEISGFLDDGKRLDDFSIFFCFPL